MRELTRPWARAAGLLGAAAILFVYDNGNPEPLHQLWLPLAFACAAYLMTRAVMAVALAALALALVHTDLGASNWVEARAYPMIVLASLIACGVIGVRRFREHIASTHDERWARRNAGRDRPGQAQD